MIGIYIMSKVCQLFSGSSGNSIFIEHKETRILVDAGVSAKRLEGALSDIGRSAENLNAIFVTHEHSDHIKGIRVLASRYNIPVFCEKKVLAKMTVSGEINEKVTAYEISNNMELNSIEIIPFVQSHDSVSCVGYRFNLPDKRSIAVCTDTGYITEQAEKTISGTDLVFLESNHEVTMLQNGFYPYSLKQRILSDKGHLSNHAAAEYAARLVNSGTTRLCLCHLSRDNNHPDIARQTSICTLTENGFKENLDFRLKISQPINNERPIVL